MKSMKTEIKKTEYLQLVGLLSLAEMHNGKLRDILKAVLEITGESEDHGHGGDSVYSDFSADDLIKKLNIIVNWDA